MRFSLLVISVWLTIIGADAQTTFSGRVVAYNSKKGLGSVSVVAENSRQKPIAFTQTKEEGAFELIIPEGKDVVQLSFSLLGYGKKTISTAKFTNGQMVALLEQALMLKEVKATSKRLRHNSDTLI